MYLVVSFTDACRPHVQDGLSLVEAYRLVGRLGRGAIFRSAGMHARARPVYPNPRLCGCGSPKQQL
jgi:hypothetical protein